MVTRPSRLMSAAPSCRDGQPSGARHIIEKKLRVLVGHAAVAVDVAEQAGGGRKSEQRARQQRRQQQRGKNPSYPIQDGALPQSISYRL